MGNRQGEDTHKSERLFRQHRLFVEFYVSLMDRMGHIYGIFFGEILHGISILLEKNRLRIEK